MPMLTRGLSKSARIQNSTQFAPRPRPSTPVLNILTAVSRVPGRALVQPRLADQGAFDHLDAVRHRVGPYGRQVVRANVDVDSQYPPPCGEGIECLTALNRIAIVKDRKHRCAENQRAA